MQNAGNLFTSGSQLGTALNATGTVTVDGAGSSWINSNGISIGSVGAGTLALSNNAVVDNDVAVIGEFATSTGTVTVDGSQFFNSGNLTVGQGGAATLTITSRGLVSNNFGSVGLAANSNGAVTVDGPGSTWTNNQGLLIGVGGTGELHDLERRHGEQHQQHAGGRRGLQRHGDRRRHGIGLDQHRKPDGGR